MERITSWDQVSTGDFVYVAWEYSFNTQGKMLQKKDWTLFKIVEPKGKKPKGNPEVGNFIKFGEVIQSSKGSSVSKGKVVGLTDTMIEHTVQKKYNKSLYFKYKQLEKWSNADVALLMI